MSLKKQRADLAEKAAKFQSRLTAGETLTDEEIVSVKGILNELEEVDGKIASAGEKAAMLEKLGSLAATVEPAGGQEQKARSLGEHFVKSLAKDGVTLRRGLRYEAPEFKAAATDISMIGGPDSGYAPYVTDIDREAVFPVSRPLTIADLMSNGTMVGSAIKYPVYPAAVGDPETVAEGGLKPQVHFGEPTWVTEALGEIAAWTGISENMAEDAPYLKAQIDQQLIRMLQIAEEDQILAGDGQGSNLTGLLNRDGVQSLTSTVAELADKIATAQANIAVATESLWRADGVVINPLDYNDLRLTKDENGQYFAGGPFTGAYGNAGLPTEPGLWNMPTVQTTAVSRGTIVVGAFKSALIFRKNGIQLATSDSHSDYFVKDLLAIRAKTRAALEVKWPSAFCAIKIS